MFVVLFFGIVGVIVLIGFDGFFYSIGFLVVYLVVLYFVVELFRNLGKYILVDMIVVCFDVKKVCGVVVFNMMMIFIFYMIV